MAVRNNPGNKRKNRKRPVSKKPGSPMFRDLPESGIARRLWAENKRIESARLFQSIIEKNPANIPALVDASRVFGGLFDYKNALSFVERVLELGQRSHSAMFLAGQSYRLLRQPARAIDCFSKSVALNPGQADAHLELAIQFERQGKLPAAREHAIKRIQLNPKDPESAFVLAKLDARSKKFPDAISRLEALVDSKAHWMTRARSLSQLARIYDQQGQFQLAWEAMLKSKQLVRQSNPAPGDTRVKMLDRLFELSHSFTCDFLEKWQANLPDQWRGALLTGLPRTGTTLLASRLHGHHAATVADEFPVFAQLDFPLLLSNRNPAALNLSYIDQVEPKNLQMAYASYTTAFEQSHQISNQETVFIDKNPSLLPLLIPYLRVMAHSKIIVTKRDPRDTLVSCMMTYMPFNDFTFEMLEIGSAIERIAKEWSHWQKIKLELPDHQYQEIQYETLVGDQQQTLKSTVDFLGLPNSDTAPSNEELTMNAMENVHSPSYEEVSKPVYATSIGRWKNYSDQLAPYQREIFDLAKQFGYE